nr:unnamed protein product [Callosobruchus analis]
MDRLSQFSMCILIFSITRAVCLNTLFIYGCYTRDNSSRCVGDHALRVIGYGAEDNKYPYWLATNSSNDHWGTRDCSR